MNGPEYIMLNEMSDREKIPYDFIYMWNFKNKQNRKRATDTENKLMMLPKRRG